MYLEFRDVSGKTVNLLLEESSEPITIGRNPGSTIYSKESTVSRNHGRIGWDGESFYMKDLGSSNGSFLNGDRMTRSTISVGDVVRCGEVLEIRLESGDPDPSKLMQHGERKRVQKPTIKSSSMSRAEERRRRMEEAEKERDRRRRAREKRRAGKGEASADSEPARKSPRSPRKSPLDSSRSARPEKARAASRSERAGPAAAGGGRSTGQSGVVESAKPSPVGRGKGDSKELKELSRKVAALESALAEAQGRADQAETKIKTSEQRSMRYSVELDGLGDKYIKLKEQNKVISAALEETREETRKREDEAFEAERRVTELETELNSAREKAADATEQFSGLKVRLTQKDRQIEELQRQLDLLEYELRSQRDEMDSLQSSFNREGGDVDRLERKINLLQEVIQEKEQIIEQVRVDLRDKDIEIRQVRMGVGISDLEHEKRRLLEDYHNATRRVDELQDRLDQKSREIDGVKSELEDLRKEVSERKPALESIEEHPDFKAKIREVERLEEKIEGMQKDMAKLEVKLEAAAGDAESILHLKGQVSVLEKRAESLSTKLETAETEIKALMNREPEPVSTAPVFSPELLEDVEGLVDAAQASKLNARLVRKYAGQIEKGVDKEDELGETAEMLYDIAVVLVQDIGEQVRTISEVHDALSAGE